MNNLNNLLRLNKHFKIELIKEEKIVKIFYKGSIIGFVPFKNDSIEDNPNLIYNYITSLENVNLYIPKVYTRKK
ncbi:hypothetical protein [Tepidibacter formicigenes]|uniref:Uncharacterized protein n=1 Tax=Tepidibacter formicigenes DSM 15518 TaxID=1123349 RepID=A0A1M6PG84_9FIRM|nr:hypothetical protein [Tepidibacter formicigenes]SHK06897.1 hypothetical protein SAMN02744037_01551 [Tepidibacter formicigenes DSM 15518]